MPQHHTDNPNIINLPVALSKMMMKHGWIVTGVENLNLYYTVGLNQMYDHPEIVIHGLPTRIAYHFLHDLVKKIAAGEKFEPGKDYPDIAANFPTQFIEVNEVNRGSWMAMAYNFNGGPTYRALQLVWTDTKGKFPWDAGFEERFREKQYLFNQSVDYPESNGCCDERCACNPKHNVAH